MSGSWMLGSVALTMQMLFIGPQTVWREFLLTYPYALRILPKPRIYPPKETLREDSSWVPACPPDIIRIPLEDFKVGIGNRFCDPTAWGDRGESCCKWLGMVFPEAWCGPIFSVPSTATPRLSPALGEMDLTHRQPRVTTKPQRPRGLRWRVPRCPMALLLSALTPWR